MKRHPSLEPFSRDHNLGLILARRLSSAETEAQRLEAADMLAKAWKDELADHFREEEALLGGLIPSPELQARLESDHREFEAMVTMIAATPLDPALHAAAGRLLNDHIRWEERVLFPAIEAYATEDQLRELAKKTAEVEKRRFASDFSGRREELVRRRKRG